MKTIAILGSTGSIGTQTLSVIRPLKRMFAVKGLASRSNLELLKTQIREFSPEIVSIWDRDKSEELKAWCKKNGFRAAVFHGIEGLTKVAVHSGTQLVVSSVVGSVGLVPLMAAVRAGKNIALANKEALVVAGNIIMAEAKKNGVAILPVDSEHSAIFQCLKNEDAGRVKRILLTASGGPFYRSGKEASKITVEDALAHPTWDMGKKITVDSATLMNKGLEAIEAHHLFGISLDRIEIIIHPQSIIHSMVEFADGSVIAQMSNPDMRLPIQYALTCPERVVSGIKPLDLVKAGSLQFSKPDFRKFPCLNIALGAGRAGGTMPAVMNAANEVAVESFLAGALRYDMIPAVIKKTMARHKLVKTPEINDILNADNTARETAEELIGKMCS